MTCLVFQVVLPAQLVAVARLLTVVRSRGLYLAAEDVPPHLQLKFLGRVNVSAGLGAPLSEDSKRAHVVVDDGPDDVVDRVRVCGEVGVAFGLFHAWQA